MISATTALVAGVTKMGEDGEAVYRFDDTAKKAEEEEKEEKEEEGAVKTQFEAGDTRVCPIPW